MTDRHECKDCKRFFIMDSWIKGICSLYPGEVSPLDACDKWEGKTND